MEASSSQKALGDGTDQERPATQKQQGDKACVGMVETTASIEELCRRGLVDGATQHAQEDALDPVDGLDFLFSEESGAD